MLAWLLPRVFAAVAVAAFGAAMGYLMGDALGAYRPLWAFVGAFAGVALVVTYDLLRARPLLQQATTESPDGTSTASTFSTTRCQVPECSLGEKSNCEDRCRPST